MFPMTVNHELELRLLSDQDVQPMFDLISRNRTHLDTWLRWSGKVQTPEDVQALIKAATAKYLEGNGFHAGLWYCGELAGGLVCHMVNRESGKSEIGYWLGEQYTGKGIVTLASRAIIAYLYTQEKLHRIEIQCRVENKRSRAVAERLGFTLEGIKRESEWIDGAYRDHALYSLLEQEWRG